MTMAARRTASQQTELSGQWVGSPTTGQPISNGRATSTARNPQEGGGMMGRQESRTGYRGLPRICVPGAVISRVVEAGISPLVLAGPELCKRLEPHAERLAGISCPSRRQRWLLAAMTWLLEERDSEPEQTEDCAADAIASLDDDLWLQDLPPEKQRLLWETFGIGAQDQQIPPLLPAEGTPSAPPVKTGRGVR